MKTPPFPLTCLFQRAAFKGKGLLLFAMLFFFGGNAHAGAGALHGGSPAKKNITTAGTSVHRPHALALPSISYATPQTYYAGHTITALTPTSSGVAAQGYGTAVTYASGFTATYRIAFDAAGNAYISDAGTGFVVKIPAGGGSRVNLGTGLAGPAGVAVDASGTYVYVANLFGGNVKKIQVSNNATTTIGSGFTEPYAVALDAAGNVYVGDAQATVIKEILAGTNTVVSIGSGFSAPIGVAVDASDNVYVADSGHNAIKEIAAGSGTVTALGSGFSGPDDVAVDNGGNIFVADANNNAIKEITAGGGAVITVRSMSAPPSVTVNGAGDVFSGTNNSASPIISEVKPTGGYYINKQLPAGLIFNNSTGVISGTPVTAVAAATYTVTAYNSSGSATAAINIKIAANSPNLSNLTVSNGSLSPAFSGATTTYSNTVFSSIAQTTITPTAADPGAAIKVNGTAVASGSQSGSLPLVTGNNVITIVVTAPDGTTTNTYTINVTRQSANDDLSALTISNGTLTPAFTSNISEYSVNLPYAASSVTVTPTTSDPNATILLNNVAQASGAVSPAIPLNVGSTFIIVRVTAQDGQTTQAYGITCNRSANVPLLTYASPQTYHTGTAIGALTPVNSGGAVAAPAYAASQILASGLNSPTGVAVDKAGDVYVVSGVAIKEFPAGGGAVITIGNGSFNSPYGIATDGAGNIYVANYGGNTINEIRAGTTAILTLASGVASPTSVTMDAIGNIYFTEYQNGDVKKIPPGGGTPVVVASGYPDAEGVAVDAAGNMYIISELATTVAKIPAGGGAATPIGSGLLDPIGIAVDASGNVFVGDNNNSRVVEIPAGTNTVNVVSGGYVHPAGVAVDGAGNVYVANSGSSNVHVVKPIGGSYIWPYLPAGLNFNNTTGVISGTPSAGGLTTNYTVTSYNSMGMGTSPVTITVNPNVPIFSYSTPKTYAPGAAITPLAPVSTGGAVAARNYGINGSVTLGSGFFGPSGVAIDAAGNVYVGDYEDHFVEKIPVGGGAPVVIGTGFGQVSGVAVDGSGNVFVADQSNSALKEILASNGSTVTLASGFSSLIYGIATDINGNVYVDEANGAITKIPPGGGAGTKVPNSISGSFALVVDGSGNLFEVTNGGVSVTEVHADGSPNTTIGSGLSMPYGIAVDGGGNVFVADGNASILAVKEFPADGSAMMLIGKGLGVRPYGVAVDGAGNIYVADQSATTITKIPPVGNYFVKPFLPAGLILDSNTGIISGTPTVVTSAANYVITGYNNFGMASATVNITTGTATSVATLSGIGSSITPLTPIFKSTTTSYTLSVANGVTSMTVKPVATDPAATIKVNGTALASGSTSTPIALAEGITTAINVLVTAQDGVTTKTYTITVTRAPSAVATLSAMGPGIGPLTPVFTPNTTSYALSVTNATATMTVKPVTTDAHATLKVNGTALAPGTTSAPVPLAEGAATAINVVVTAQDGTTVKTYTITVTRAPSGVATLSAIGSSITPLTPIFNSATTSYRLSVPNGTTSMTVKPITTDAHATLKVNGTAIPSGTISGPIALAVGSNTVTTVVLAQDGATTKTYIITVTRASGGADSFDPVSVTKPTESPTLAEDGIIIHQAVSPNGDGVNDFLQIDNISQYPDNKLIIMNRSGQLIFEAKTYDNSSKVFDGHSNKNGQMQLPGTYFYQLDYTVNGIVKHKTGFIVLKY